MKISYSFIKLVMMFLLLVSDVALAESRHRPASRKHMHHHDEVNMPGLRGENASAEETSDLAVLFRNFETLSREVENLPNGIKTVTRSSNSKVMEVLVRHAVGMIGRVEQKDDPKIFIQSPTLNAFFLHGDQIDSEIEITDEGIVIVRRQIILHWSRRSRSMLLKSVRWLIEVWLLFMR